MFLFSCSFVSDVKCVGGVLVFEVNVLYSLVVCVVIRLFE